VVRERYACKGKNVLKIYIYRDPLSKHKRKKKKMKGGEMHLGKLKGLEFLTFHLSPQLNLPLMCWFLEMEKGVLWQRKEDVCCTEKNQAEPKSM
jgi:hypothetical protein